MRARTSTRAAESVLALESHDMSRPISAILEIRNELDFFTGVVLFACSPNIHFADVVRMLEEGRGRRSSEFAYVEGDDDISTDALEIVSRHGTGERRWLWTETSPEEFGSMNRGYTFVATPVGDYFLVLRDFSLAAERMDPRDWAQFVDRCVRSVLRFRADPDSGSALGRRLHAQVVYSTRDIDRIRRTNREVRERLRQNNGFLFPAAGSRRPQ